MARAICFLSLPLLLASLAAAQSYTVTDLGTLAGDSYSVGVLAWVRL